MRNVYRIMIRIRLRIRIRIRVRVRISTRVGIRVEIRLCGGSVMTPQNHTDKQTQLTVRCTPICCIGKGTAG